MFIVNLCFGYLCTANNITVLEPKGDNKPYDFVIELDGKFKKIQVKTSRAIKNGAPIFHIGKTTGYKKEIPYTKEDVDYFFFYDLINNAYALVPFEDMPSGCKIQLRNQKAKINHPSIKYFDDYDLLK